MLEETSCCGVLEYDGVTGQTPTKILLNICENKYDNWEGYKSAFITFTDVAKSSNGKNLYSYILKNKLGTVVKTRARTNPNTRRKIKIWVWSPNETNLRKWYKSEKKQSPKPKPTENDGGFVRDFR